jgi:phage terminase large subunit-like protein
LLPDGRPRFRQVLVLVARQNGKTELLVILTLYWLYVERVRLVLGTSTNLDYARESWEKAVTRAEETTDLAAEIAPNGIRRANGEQALSTVWGGRYKIAASNRKGGRSLTIDRLVMDELREHHDWDAYNAAIPATNAVWDAQAYLISNQGDDRSVVLNALRDQSIEGLDERLGIFEWSSPDGMDATDVEALAMANPNLGRRINLDALMGDAKRAQAAGGEQLAAFLTEVHCRRVSLLNPAIDMEAW